MKPILRKYSTVILSVAIVMFVGVGIAFASPAYYEPGQVTAPTCAPGSTPGGIPCTVNTIGYDTLGNVLASNDTGTDTYGYQLSLGAGGVIGSGKNGSALFGDDTSTNTAGIMGIVDRTGHGGGPNNPEIDYVSDITSPSAPFGNVTIGPDSSGNVVLNEVVQGNPNPNLSPGQIDFEALALQDGDFNLGAGPEGSNHSTGTLYGVFGLSKGEVVLGNTRIGSTGNSTTITVDDIHKLITMTNVPQYANDAAAEAGGLSTGQLYETTTGGTTALNIVP